MNVSQLKETVARLRVSPLASAIARLKPYIRWMILGGTLFFLAHTLRQHWQEVAVIRIDQSGWIWLAIALFTTLGAHIWAGWVWGWILEELGYRALGTWSILAYLKTNIAKYLPGNVWHFYGRMMAAKSVGVPIEGAAVSVVMEPLLMATAALIVAFISNQRLNMALQLLGLCIGMILVHPRVMNPVLKKLAIAKAKIKSQHPSPSRQQVPVPDNGHPAEHTETSSPYPPTSLPTYSSTFPATYTPTTLKRYPILPLIGELIFLALRGAGFIFAMMAIHPLTVGDILPLLSAFSLAWMLGLLVPGAPGGIGVFEATALALLNGSFPAASLLGAVAFYRLVSTLAEAIGAGVAWGTERLTGNISP